MSVERKGCSEGKETRRSLIVPASCIIPSCQLIILVRLSGLPLPCRMPHVVQSSHEFAMAARMACNASRSHLSLVMCDHLPSHPSS
jgi:hypothetical protein